MRWPKPGEDDHSFIGVWAGLALPAAIVLISYLLNAALDTAWTIERAIH